MIETGLVYIYSVSPAHAFKGCGVLLEGGYVATCRHVWRLAAPAGQPPEVEIVFPRTRDKQGALVASRASMADDCEGLETPAPDLVLLKPLQIPAGAETVPLARHRSSEVGAAYALAGLMGLDENKPSFVRDVPIKGEIADYKDAAEGMRKFTGDNLASFFSDRGASGSPIFLEHGHTHSAGILVLSVLGANDGKTHLREAFVLPATTIIRFLGRHLVKSVAGELGIDLAPLQSQIDGLCAQDHVPTSEFAALLRENFGSLRVQAAKEVPASNDGADIDATIAASREKLAAFNTAGALDILRAKIEEEKQMRALRLVPLLMEQAAVERLAFDHEAAKRTLRSVTQLTPDDAWAFILLGDLHRLTGPLEEAEKAFRQAEAAARRQADERAILVALIHVGDVQRARGDLDAALKSYNDGIAIAYRLSISDPENALWQSDLSVSYEAVGDMQMDQGNLDGALKSYQDSLTIANRLATMDRDNAEWQRHLSASCDRLGNVQMRQGEFVGALKSYNDSLAIRQGLAESDPGDTGWQRDLSVSFNKIGDVKKKQADLEGALASYRAGLDIVKTLARRDPANSRWQHDLSVSWSRIGSVLMAQGDINGARTYQASIDILETLSRRDPANTEWQNDLLATRKRLGIGVSVRQTLAHRQEPQVDVDRSFAFRPGFLKGSLGFGRSHLDVEDVGDSTSRFAERLEM